jgi:hypothetical protein
MQVTFTKYAYQYPQKDITVVYDIGSNSHVPRRGDYVELEGLDGRVVAVKWILGKKSVTPKIEVVVED